MDLTRQVTYQGLNLNDATFDNNPTDGIQLDSVQWPGVQGVGYTEKRSQADGFDASDVYLGLRRIFLRGTIYGSTRALLYDRMQSVRSALSPTSAYTASPGDFGFLPLTFEEPTTDTANFTDGYKPLQVFARPVQTPSFSILRDAMGGVAGRGGGIVFEAALEAKDPRIYVRPEVVVAMPTTVNTKSGNLKNRGDYPAPLNIMFIVPLARGNGKMTITAAGSQMEITVGDSVADQIFRYDGTLKVLTVETNSVESLRMDLLKFLNETTYPLVPAGTSAYTWTSTFGFVGANSRLWFWESFA
jgi:hypothetical protein